MVLNENLGQKFHMTQGIWPIGKASCQNCLKLHASVRKVKNSKQLFILKIEEVPLKILPLDKSTKYDYTADFQISNFVK